jgi:DNA N-6-adenine-methyltransferase (Dam)
MITQLPTGLVDKPLPASLSCKSIEYYTPAPYIEAAREVMDSIDVDPASNVIANQIVKAGIYYTKETNGIDKPWPGNVFLNPPYGFDSKRPNQARWSQRLIEQYQAGITKQAVLLVNAATETHWFQALWDYPVCFPCRRVDFYIPDGSISRAVHSSAFIYLGSRIEEFALVFRQFGRIVRAMNPPTLPTLWEVVI